MQQRRCFLGLAKEQGRAALDVAQIDIVSEARADNLPSARGDDHNLRLGIVPGRHRMQSHIRTETDRRHRLALGENLRVGADADLEIL